VEKKEIREGKKRMAEQNEEGKEVV